MKSSSCGATGIWRRSAQEKGDQAPSFSGAARGATVALEIANDHGQSIQANARDRRIRIFLKSSIAFASSDQQRAKAVPRMTFASSACPLILKCGLFPDAFSSAKPSLKAWKESRLSSLSVRFLRAPLKITRLLVI